EDHQRVVLLDALTDLDNDLPEVADELRLDFHHSVTSPWSSHRRHAVLAPGAMLPLGAGCLERFDDHAARVRRFDDVVDHRPRRRDGRINRPAIAEPASDSREPAPSTSATERELDTARTHEVSTLGM